MEEVWEMSEEMELMGDQSVGLNGPQRNCLHCGKDHCRASHRGLDCHKSELHHCGSQARKENCQL